MKKKNLNNIKDLEKKKIKFRDKFEWIVFLPMSVQFHIFTSDLYTSAYFSALVNTTTK